MLKIHTVVRNGILFTMLKVPLVDQKPEFLLYKIHNLPIPVQKTRKMIKYQLEYNYIGISKDKMYVTLPSNDEVLGCQISAGSFYEINSAIFTSHKSLN